MTQPKKDSNKICIKLPLLADVRHREALNARPMIWASFLFFCLFFLVGGAGAIDPASADQLLSKAEQLKRSNFDDFVKLLNSIDGERASLTPAQRDHLTYLRAWERTYAGEFDIAIPEFKSLIARPIDPVLRSRAIATLVNALTVGRRYDESFKYLTQLLDQLPQISEKDVRSQALGVAALLHNQVGQYDLSLEYSDRMLNESTTPWVLCGAAQFKFDSLLKSGRLKEVNAELESWVQRCIDAREYGFANFMRTYLARLHVANDRYDEAIKLLLDNRSEAERTRYPRLISEFDSLLASTYWLKNDVANARLYALSAVQNGTAKEFTPPLVDAYRVLSQLSEKQGNAQEALDFHKKYMAADKAYLDDVSARQLAFQMAQHQAVSSKLQIETLNQQNQVLKLKEDLAAKAVQNFRLSIALLLAFLAFIALWAYKTKRSQLHFMRQAQHDSLTGIFNRHHFIQLSEIALDSARRTHGSCSVVIIDLDHFKIINDAHGHAAGDTVLKQAVTACRQLLGHNDIFGRLGGEEFGLMLPDRDAAAAMQLAEKCRLAIAETDTGDGRDEFPISASFGVTSTAVSGFKLQQMLAHADSALYLAKRQGRNRVELYKGGPMHPGPASKEFSAAH
jgi:diguanylate cyclase (GGDEF)-like protein